MGEITAITAQKKDKTRCNIYIDGAFYCGLKIEVAVKNRLKTGQHVDPAALSQMQFESEKAVALDKALTHISVTMKTEKQIVDFLKGKGYVDEVVGYVVEKMKSYGYIDDEEYARQYVRSAGKSKGKRLLSLELERKGVKREDAARAAEGAQGEEEAALAVLTKYMRNKEPTKENLQKAFRYLTGRGFGYETVKDALRRYGETDEDTGI